MLESIITDTGGLARADKLQNALTRLTATYKGSIEKSVKYYSSEYGAVTGSHVLMRLLYSLIEDKGMSLTDVYAKAKSAQMEHTTGLGITNDINPGRLHDDFGHTYGALVSCDFYDLTVASVGYKDIVPVRYISHNLSGGGLELPDERKGDNLEIAVVGVDIPSLAVMFNAWSRENDKKVTTERDSPNRFVYKHLLSGMLPSKNVCLFRNALSKYFVPKGNNVPFQVQDNFRDIVKELGKGVREFGDNTRHEDFLVAFDGLYADSIIDEVPDMGSIHISTGNAWSQILSSLGFLNVLFDICSDDPNKTTVKNRIRRKVRQIRSSRLLANVPDDKLRVVVNAQLKELDEKF